MAQSAGVELLLLNLIQNRRGSRVCADTNTQNGTAQAILTAMATDLPWQLLAETPPTHPRTASVLLAHSQGTALNS